MRKLAYDVVRQADWPSQDRTAWTNAVASGKLFDVHGPLAHYPPERLTTLAASYGRWLGYLGTLEEQAAGKGFLGLAQPELVSGFVNSLSAVAPCSKRGYLTDLLTVARALRPGSDLGWLHKAVRHAWRIARPVTNKIDRMVPACDLARLGFEIMAEAPSLSTPLQRAAHYRDGLMIAMLINAPARIGSFVAMEIGKQVISDGRRFCLSFRPEDVKTRCYLEYPLPESLTEAIQTWLDVHRPECLSHRGRSYHPHDGSAFWISCDGTPFNRASSVRERIERITQQRLGRCINPHLFRDIAATSIASEIPEDVGIIVPVLGHADARSGERHYNQAGSINAARALHDILATFRHSSEKDAA